MRQTGRHTNPRFELSIVARPDADQCGTHRRPVPSRVHTLKSRGPTQEQLERRTKRGPPNPWWERGDPTSQLTPHRPFESRPRPVRLCQCSRHQTRVLRIIADQPTPKHHRVLQRGCSQPFRNACWTQSLERQSDRISNRRSPHHATHLLMHHGFAEQVACHRVASVILAYGGHSRESSPTSCPRLEPRATKRQYAMNTAQTRSRRHRAHGCMRPVSGFQVFRRKQASMSRG